MKLSENFCPKVWCKRPSEVWSKNSLNLCKYQEIKFHMLCARCFQLPQLCANGEETVWIVKQECHSLQRRRLWLPVGGQRVICTSDLIPAI